MGRIKTTLIKRTTKDLMEKHSDELNTDFNDNKKVVGQHIDTQSNKLRNMIAGYATRLKRRENSE
jgi:small subunit ribosomal protein S17e